MTIDGLREKIRPVHIYIKREEEDISYKAEMSYVNQAIGFLIGMFWLFKVVIYEILSVPPFIKKYGLLTPEVFGAAFAALLLIIITGLIAYVISWGSFKLKCYWLRKRHPFLFRAIDLRNAFDQWVTSGSADNTVLDTLARSLESLQTDIAIYEEKASSGNNS